MRKKDRKIPVNKAMMTRRVEGEKRAQRGHKVHLLSALACSKLTMIAGTLQTDPRSGGIKRSSGVNVMPAIAEGASEAKF